MCAYPIQKLPISKKDKTWKKDNLDYFEKLSYGSGSSNRNTNYSKKINYDLYNGKFNKADLEYVCNPLGIADNEMPATLQHMDIVSPALNLLIGEEGIRPDNCMVVSESTIDITRKQKEQKDKIMYSLQQHLVGKIDPSTIDPNNPPPTPEQIIKYDKYNVSDLIESKANKLHKHLKQYLNTKETFKRGWKDVLCAGEEIYWTGVSNNEVIFRRCNPLNTTVILDGDSEQIDAALAVIEVRMLAPSTILDELGDELTSDDVTLLEAMSRRHYNRYGNTNNSPTFSLTTNGIEDTGISNFSATNTAGSYLSDLIRVVRVEWKSFKRLYHLTYTDENGEEQAMTVDESFQVSKFKQAFPDAKTEEYWINEAWEGIKIGNEIYIAVQPKPNQRRRMDNPYYCKLGYTGLIHNSTNSQSVSLMDRLKPYQYLYNIISYRLELAFASDQGKIMLMDLAQIPRSEGIDIDKWMYYLKAMKIGFINSFEEGKKGSHIGKTSNFNQFQSIDLSLSNTIQQYIQTLEYIKQQTAFISGVTPQRLGAISSNELVGNVERAVQQSSVITEYLFDAHDEIKRRVYVALIECAKIAYKDGKKIQFILDDMGIELLDIEENDFDDSEFNVFMSHATKDNEIFNQAKELMKLALQSDKADLSSMVEALINNSPRDMLHSIQRGEEAKHAREKAIQDQQGQIEQSKIKAQQDMVARQEDSKQKDRDLKQYEVDSINETKIQVAEIGVYARQQELDQNNNGIPDPLEIGRLALDREDVASKAFMERSKLDHDKMKHQKVIDLKDKELKMKQEIENKKIEAIRVQNVSQEKISKDESARADKELNAKIQIEKLKLAAAKAKANKSKK